VKIIINNLRKQMSLGGGWALVRQQENSSFANFGRVSAGVVCKCAVLCVGFFIFLLCLYAAKFHLSFCRCLFLRLVANARRVAYRWRIKARSCQAEQR